MFIAFEGSPSLSLFSYIFYRGFVFSMPRECFGRTCKGNDLKIKFFLVKRYLWLTGGFGKGSQKILGARLYFILGWLGYRFLGYYLPRLFFVYKHKGFFFGGPKGIKLEKKFFFAFGFW